MMDDPAVCMVEVKASEELAPLAINLFEKLGAFQVPSSGVTPMKDPKGGKSFIVMVYIDSDEIMKSIRRLGFVLEVYSSPRIEAFGPPIA